tara:strand:+ start:267 stop:1235 length:969 start_codon:yes stop_codon:yes gene_type:complete
MAEAGHENSISSIGFLLLPGFSLLSFSSAIDPLRQANRLTGKALYSWRIYSDDGLPARSSSGLEIAADASVMDDERPDLLLVNAGINGHMLATRGALGYLRRLAVNGHRIGAVSAGTWLLAQAGILEGHRCTIHWEDMPGLKEAYPELDVTEDVFEIDRRRVTCSGGTAGLDLMLHLIQQDHGAALARDVADQYQHERMREQTDRQGRSLENRIRAKSPKLMRAISAMQMHLDTPLTREEIAGQIGLSTRQLERLFHRHLGLSPRKYYMDMRLRNARLLLLQTGMSVLEVAVASGFVSASHFSKCYRDLFQHTPTQERDMPD